MSRTLIIGVCVLQIAILVQCSGLYSIVGPGTLRSKSVYHVTVSVFDNPSPCKIKVGLTGPDLDLSETVEMTPKSSKIVKFDVPKLKDGEFNLTAAGLSGIEFKNSTKLNFAGDQLNIYIQTDKATYKPGDKVQFRVLILDENTRPAKVEGPITIAINDGAKNRIKQWTKVELTKGVYAGELQLSEQPVLGSWAIEVTADGTTTNKNFEVDKYVLPKFEVEVDAPKDVPLADESVRVIIRAKYTYGKPVKGKAVVTVKPSYHYYGNDEITAMKTIDVDGKGYAEFNFAKDLKISQSQYTPPLTILAVVEEELTGVKQNSTGKINLHREKYQIQGVDVPYVYNPGEPVVIIIVVKNLDGSPVQDTKNPVTLTVSPPDYWLSRPVPRVEGDVAPSTVPPPIKTNISISRNLNKDGMAKFEVTLPDADQAYYSVKASYLDVTSYITSLSKYTKSSVVEDEKLKITVQTKKPALGKDISIRLSNKSPIPCFVYTIVGRGDIIKSEIVEVPEKRNYHIFKITPTFAMIPRATIFVHFVLGNDLVFTEETINFDNQFENSISLDVPTQAKPGEDVKINVKTDPESYVGLLGVDQSVLLLKSGNDLDKNTIFQDLSRYDSRTPWTYGYGQYPGTQSGLVTMTNANFPFRQAFSVAHFPPFVRRPILPRNNGIHLDKVYTLDSVEREELVRPLMAVTSNRRPSETKPPEVRKVFPETWIYTKSITVDGNGISLDKKVPDTITSWVVTAFSLNPKTGLAITDQPSKMRVFQPFFISTNLPYSVKRGEVIAIPVIIFNYLDKNLDAEVTMDNTDKDYEFTEATNEVTESASEDVKRTKTLSIPANSGKSVSFMIRPKKVGQIPLKITAISPLAGDAVHQNLKVEPEGVTTFVNKAVFLNLATGTTRQDKIEVVIPENAIPDSQYIELSVVGNLLGPTIKNLDKLVRIPYGCGEQNMVNFVPNILVLKYLTAIKQLPESIETKAKKFLEIGYQRQLMYKHDDGSYSAFGKSDDSGSTWLTAYVVKSFHQAIPYTDIDPKVIEQGLKFLAKQQNMDGEFPEVGKVIDSSHSGGKVGLTGFVLLAFLENAESADKYIQTIESGLNYLEKELPNTDDLYSLAVGMTALLLGKRPAAAEKIFAKLDGMAQTDGDRKWWSQTVDSKYSWYGPRSIDVVITSYIVTALMYKETPEEVLPIIRWLISQRNSNGGFASTQDTVVGLEALIKFAELSGSGTGTMDIEFTTNEKSAPEKITVNPETALILQTHVLPPTTKSVDLTASGSGSTLAQVSYRYNLADKGQKPQFTVKPVVKTSPKDLLVMDICTEFVPLDDSKKSNMAVMEVSLPSGYTADADSFGNIEAVESVKRVETKNSDSMVIIYFDELTPTERCIPVNAIKSHAVAKQKPAPVVVYDYYDNNKRATDYYEVKSSLCDICEGDDCGSGCGKKN